MPRYSGEFCLSHLSRDEDRWAQLQDSLALYRLAFGQPRQEDMLAALQRRGITGRPEEIDGSAESICGRRCPSSTNQIQNRRGNTQANIAYKLTCERPPYRFGILYSQPTHFSPA